MEKQINSKASFNKLLKGIIACTSISLGLVVVTTILVFAFGASIAFIPDPDPQPLSALMFALFCVVGVLSIVELANDIVLAIFAIISMVRVGEVKQINANNFRLTFGLLLGFFVLFMILSNFYNVFSFFQLITIILLLVFAVVYRNKLKQ